MNTTIPVIFWPILIAAIVMVAFLLLQHQTAPGDDFDAALRAETDPPLSPRPAPRTHTRISIYSASDTAGGYYVPPDATLRTVSPTPCEMMTLAMASSLPASDTGATSATSATSATPLTRSPPPVVVTSKAVNGLQLRELLAGGPVQMAAQGLGTDGGSVLPFAKQLETDDATLVVLGCGMVDCFFTGITLSDYLALVRDAVGQIRLAGKEPALRGYNRFAQTALMTREVLSRRDQFDAALRAEAWALRVPFIDVGSVAFAGLTDLCADELHPSLDYHWRIARCIGQRLSTIQIQ